MAEAFQCDRCGRTKSGKPDNELVLGEGRGRSRRSRIEMDERYEYPPGTITAEFDLCDACHDELRKWWADGGGEPGEIE